VHVQEKGFPAVRIALSEIIGQAHLVGALSRAVRDESPAHSYLFEGPPNVGKTTTALAFGRALLCEAAEGQPCEQCRSCKLTAAGTHPDLRIYRPVISASPPGKPHLWQTAPSHMQMSLLPIDRIRDLRDATALRPAFGKRKVVVLEEADRMTEDSQNCALKTLEEPAGNTLLILTAVNGRRFLPTILSRCQRVTFRHVPAVALREWLATRDTPTADADLLTRLAEGRPGRGVRLGSDRQLWEARRNVAALVEQLVRAHPLEAMRLGEEVMELAEQLWTEEPDVPAFTELKGTDRTRAVRSKCCEVVDWMTSWFHDLLLLALGATADRVINADDLSWLSDVARERGPQWARGALLALGFAHRYLLQNANVKLILDALFTGIVSGRMPAAGLTP